MFQVYVGSLTYVVGYLDYVTRPIIDEIMLAITVPLIIIMVIVLCIIKRRKGKWDNKIEIRQKDHAQSNLYSDTETQMQGIRVPLCNVSMVFFLLSHLNQYIFTWIMAENKISIVPSFVCLLQVTPPTRCPWCPATTQTWAVTCPAW